MPFGGFQEQKGSDDYSHQLEQKAATLLPCTCLRMITCPKKVGIKKYADFPFKNAVWKLFASSFAGFNGKLQITLLFSTSCTSCQSFQSMFDARLDPP
jgi:hypothetical protein